MSLKSPIITLVLADDHAIVRRGLSEFLGSAGDIEVVASANNGAQAIACAEQYVPDVLLLDLLMPDLPPVHTVRAIKSVSPRTQIIILTSHEGSEYVVPATRAGAISYILKDISPDDLITAVRDAASGVATISPKMAQSLLSIVDRDEQPIADCASLTAREIEVLSLLADAKSNAVIADTLGISGKTVKSHVSHILGKLYLSDRTEAAVFAWRERIKR
jgi:NarL family two-component system response regulator LiaR